MELSPLEKRPLLGVAAEACGTWAGCMWAWAGFLLASCCDDVQGKAPRWRAVDSVMYRVSRGHCEVGSSYASGGIEILF